MVVTHVTTAWWSTWWWERSGGLLPVVLTGALYGLLFRLATWRFVEERDSLRRLFSEACQRMSARSRDDHRALLRMAELHDAEFHPGGRTPR